MNIVRVCAYQSRILGEIIGFRIKTRACGNNRAMREIGQNLDNAKQQVKSLLNIPVLIKVNSGRGKSTLLKGEVTAVFPAVFSVRLDTGEIKTFSYADIHTHTVVLRIQP